MEKGRARKRKHPRNNQHKRRANRKDHLTLRFRELGGLIRAAGDTATELKATITPDTKRRIEVIPTEEIEAYDLYNKGRNYYYRYLMISHH